MSDKISTLNFSILVEHHVRDCGLSYIDAIVDLCEKNDIEYDSIKNSLNSNIKEKVELEAKKLNLMMDNDISPSLF